MVTVILTVWKRNNLQEQIDCILRQTCLPDQIWIYHCSNYVEPRFKITRKYSKVSIQYNTSDLGYFGRFSLALTSRSKYIYLLDDDVIPSDNWLENSIKLCSEQNCIVSSAGRIIPNLDYNPEIPKFPGSLSQVFIGDGDNSSATNLCVEDTIVDYGCNSWFFKAEWLHLFWSFKPYTLETAEDIHLSASCYLKSGIKTICPEQSASKVCGNLKKKYGFDNLASWRQKDFYISREKTLKYWIDECGWRPQYWTD